MSTMTGAEMRARLTYLGLSPAILAEMHGWDPRDLRREAAGTIPVSDRTQRRLRELEDQARREVAELHKLPGTIHIPRFKGKDEETPEQRRARWQNGDMPDPWHHAITGRYLNEAGPNASPIEYA